MRTVVITEPGGEVLDFTFVDTNGKTQAPHYLVPSEAECPKCHANDGSIITLGPWADQLNRDFTSGLGKVAYHAPCHLRAQKIGFPGERVLGLLPDTDIEMIERCSAVDGTELTCRTAGSRPMPVGHPDAPRFS